MRIRMRAEDSYPLDEPGCERVLPRGGVFEVPDTIAEAMIERETAEPTDPPPVADPGDPPTPAHARPTASRGRAAAQG